jgi:hypothetical protein
MREVRGQRARRHEPTFLPTHMLCWPSRPPRTTLGPRGVFVRNVRRCMRGPKAPQVSCQAKAAARRSDRLCRYSCLAWILAAPCCRPSSRRRTNSPASNTNATCSSIASWIRFSKARLVAPRISSTGAPSYCPRPRSGLSRWMSAA